MAKTTASKKYEKTMNHEQEVTENNVFINKKSQMLATLE